MNSPEIRDFCEIPLGAARFGRLPRLIAATGSLRVTGFRYSSGVDALRIDNGVGHIVVLPTVGQQIWDAQFHGRRLTMQSIFDEPVRTSDYLSNYGGYLIHCGGSAMGNPGLHDTHPLHGELPNSELESTSLYLAPAGPTLPARIGVVGSLTHRRAFDSFVRARLELWVREGSGVMTSRVHLINASREPRPLMYLAHINFRPAIGGDLLEFAPSGFDLTTRPDVGGASVTAGDAERSSPATTASYRYSGLLEPGRRVEPELVQTLAHRSPPGEVRFEQHHPDGSTDVVAQDTTTLPHTVRWLRRSADDQAFGFALPATAGPDGLVAESARGRVARFPHGEGIRAAFRHGALAVGEALPDIAPPPDVCTWKPDRDDDDCTDPTRANQDEGVDERWHE